MKLFPFILFFVCLNCFGQDTIPPPAKMTGQQIIDAVKKDSKDLKDEKDIRLVVDERLIKNPEQYIIITDEIESISILTDKKGSHVNHAGPAIFITMKKHHDN